MDTSAFKISFRYDFDPDNLVDKVGYLQVLLNEKHISTLRTYAPSRNSIKVLFPNEEELNKVFTCKEFFERKKFFPRILRTLKTKRTVFCSGFDTSLLETYDKNDIKDLLEKDNWGVSEIFVMNNYRSLKIEFVTIHQARTFLDDPNTSIGGIRLHNQHKVKEVNSLIDQCWGCGRLQTNHSSQNCIAQICLYCGKQGHHFYNCVIPRNFDEMTSDHKAMRYCVPCNTTGDHTSLDHSLCPTKKEILRERIRVNRELRHDQIQSIDKDLNIFKNLIDQTFSDTQPNLTLNKQNTQMTTLITMALIEEAFTPGVFQNKLTAECEANGLLPIKYTLEPNTAKEFVKTLCGAKDLAVTQDSSTETIHISKYSKDQLGGKKYLDNLAKFNQTVDERLATLQDLSEGAVSSIPYLLPSRRRLTNFYMTNRPNDATSNILQGKDDLNPEDLRHDPDLRAIQRCHNQVSYISNFKEDDLCNDSGKTVDPNPEYLRHLHDLNSRIPTQVSKVAYISDSSDSDY